MRLYKYIFFASLLFVVLIGCKSDKRDVVSSDSLEYSKSKSKSSPKEEGRPSGDRGVSDTTRTLEEIFGSKGVLVLEGGKGEWVLSNKDGGIYAVINNKDDFIYIKGDTLSLHNVELGDKILKNKGFNPKEFYPSYGVIQFEVSRIIDGNYEVFVNDDNEEKIISKNYEGLKFEDWRSHILGSFVSISSGVKIRESPVHTAGVARDKPSGCAATVMEIQGNWMKISCDTGCTIPDLQGQSLGWIEWRDADGIRISLRYAC